MRYYIVDYTYFENGQIKDGSVMVMADSMEGALRKAKQVYNNDMDYIDFEMPELAYDMVA